MHNPLLKFRQSSIISEKPGYFSEELKTLTSYSYHRILYFLVTFCTRFLLTNAFKRLSGFFLFCLDLELLINLVSVSVQKLDLFLFWQITQDQKKTKKNPKHLLQTLAGRKRVRNFSKNDQTKWQLELVKIFNF